MPLVSSYTTDFGLAQTGYGWKNLFGTYLPPGGQVAAFVRSTGMQTGDDPYLSTVTGTLVTTLAAGLAKCRSGAGDTVIVLPGHSESVTDNTMLTNLVAGTRIIGVGQGSNRPVFRWTNTAGQWVLNKNDVIIAGLHLQMEGANGVVLAIEWTGADCALVGCDVETASGASNKATNPIEINTGAHRGLIGGNIFRGTATHNSTDGILISAAVDQFRILSNEFAFSVTAAAHGIITVNAAATQLRIMENFFDCTMTASVQGIYLADVASTGILADNYFSVLTNGTAASSGIVWAGVTNSLVKCFQNFCSDEKQKSGVLAPGAVST